MKLHEKELADMSEQASAIDDVDGSLSDLQSELAQLNQRWTDTFEKIGQRL